MTFSNKKKLRKINSAHSIINIVKNSHFLSVAHLKNFESSQLTILRKNYYFLNIKAFFCRYSLLQAISTKPLHLLSTSNGCYILLYSINHNTTITVAMEATPNIFFLFFILAKRFLYLKDFSFYMKRKLENNLTELIYTLTSINKITLHTLLQASIKYKL
uniref:hypothetical protein n=1 Tax=Cryptomonas gyropyrenoidosa TaxID=233257 RepID=UPI0027986AF9|nr:hypothetical protein QLP26_mgp14 [Cryptomonas gyropyrenoidosa]WFQ82701.1 hypothetical protein [Cryptomonas gyropyrenoidosa]